MTDSADPYDRIASRLDASAILRQDGEDATTWAVRQLRLLRGQSPSKRMPYGAMANLEGSERDTDAGGGYEAADDSPPTDQLHPLAAFMRYQLNTVRAPEFLIDGVLAAGNVVIAGSRGVGKTTALVPLLALCAHLCRPDHPLRPKLRRRVIYITEDPDQVLRVLYSLRHFGGVNASDADFEDWFRVVPAVRMSVERLVDVAAEYVKLAHTNRGANGTEYLTLPVVVFDTRSAIIDVDDENSNAQSSRITAVLRQRFAALPTVTVAHTPKAISRGDLAQMTTRGAGAQEADVQQVAYLFADDVTGKRYLSIGGAAKKRFESDIDEVEFSAVVNDVLARDVLGDQVPLRAIHAEAMPIRSSQRHQESAHHLAERDKQEVTRRRTALLDAADAAWRSGSPLSKTALLGKVGGRKADTSKLFEALVGESWLHVIEVPSGMRENSARAAFVVRLQEDERRVFIETGRLPLEKEVIPPCWRKADAPG